jgi:hypothetical protein
MSNYCHTLEPIPQFLGTCWFNAILTCLLYSQGLSNVIRKKAMEEDWLHSTDVFKVVLNRILIYIKKIRKITDETKRKEINKQLNKYLNDVKPELILIKYAYKYHKKLYDNLKTSLREQTIVNLGHTYGNIVYILQILNINFIIQWINNKNKIYKKTYFGENSNLDEFIIININFDKMYFYINNYCIFKPLEEFDRDIDIDRFEKDCCIVSNFPNYCHGISCITCNNQGFIYNGWKNIERANKPCYLTPFDWKSHINNKEEVCFILNQGKCQLDYVNKDTTDKSNYCFNFNYNNNLVLIYVSKVYYYLSRLSYTSSMSKSGIDKYILLSNISDFYEIDKYDNIEKIIRNLFLLINKIKEFNKNKLILIYIYLKNNILLYDLNLEELRIELIRIINNPIYNGNLNKEFINNIYSLICKLNKKAFTYREINLTNLIKLVSNPDIYIDKYVCIVLLKTLHYDIDYFNKIEKIIFNEDNNIEKLKEILKIIIYYYYKPNSDNEEALFYAIYHQLIINDNTSFISMDGMDIYDPSIIDKFDDFIDEDMMKHLTLKEVYKIIIQYFQVNKIYKILNDDLTIDIYKKHLFYEFLFKLYYLMNYRKLSNIYECDFSTKPFSFTFKGTSLDDKEIKLLYINERNEPSIIMKEHNDINRENLYGIFIGDSKY